MDLLVEIEQIAKQIGRYRSGHAWSRAGTLTRWELERQMEKGRHWKRKLNGTD
jgi:hypothetical protein